jgi:hypothetical protein
MVALRLRTGIAIKHDSSANLSEHDEGFSTVSSSFIKLNDIIVFEKYLKSRQRQEQERAPAFGAWEELPRDPGPGHRRRWAPGRSWCSRRGEEQRAPAAGTRGPGGLTRTADASTREGRRASDGRRGNREQGDTEGDGEVSCGARNEGQGVGRLGIYSLLWADFMNR